MSEGTGRLAATLGVDEGRLAPLASYDEDRLRRLEGLVRAALAREDQEFADAVDRTLALVPRPLRGTVRKVLRPKDEA